MTDDEKKVLCKGLDFSVKPGLIEYSEFLLLFELLFRDIKREDLCNEGMSLIKARLLDTALTSYQNFSSDRDPPENLKPSKVCQKKRFAEKICQQDSNLNMASLDVDSLFTKIPLDETIDICVDNLYNDNENPPNIPRHDFCHLLNITTKESFFMFNNKYYKQVDGVAMISPLSPTLANIFMCSCESKWVRDCPNDFKPVFYRRYVDDIFALFSSPDHADKFKKCLSSKHININFSIGKRKMVVYLF